MAVDKKITQLPEDTAPTLTDLLALVDIETGLTKKVLLSAVQTLLNSAVPPVGAMLDYAGNSAPSGYLLCDGSAVSRSTYSSLFSTVSPTIGTFTVTIAAPAVVTLNSHGLITGDQVYLTTTNALPTGLTANTLYYVVRIDANSFNLSTSRANAYAGTKITTTGSQSGVHTLTSCPWGLGNGSTTFNVPDTRGRTLAAADAMGGTAASRMTLARSQGSYGNLGAAGGAESHVIVTAELASHTHTQNSHNHTQDAHSHQEQVATSSGGGATGITGTANLQGNTGATQSTQAATATNQAATATNQNTGSDTAHNNVQPVLMANKIIKT